MPRLRAEQDQLIVAIHDRQDWKQWTTIDKWHSYEITYSVWEDCNNFRLRPTPDAKMLKTFKYPGQGIEIHCNDHPQMTGIAEQVEAGAHAEGAMELTLAGRDNAGLLVDSSAPRMGVAGLTFKQLLEKLLAPWYPERITGITTNNAVNFYRAVGKKVKVYEPGPVRAWENWTTRKVAKVTNAKQVLAAVGLNIGGVTPKIEWRDVTKWKVRGGTNSPFFAGTEEPHLKRIRGGEKVMDIIKDLCKAVAVFPHMSPDSWFTVAKPRYNEQPYGKLVFKEKSASGAHVKGVRRATNIQNRFATYLAYGKGRKKRRSKGRDNRHSYGTFDPSPAFWKLNNAGELVELLYKPCIIEARRGSKDAKMLRRLLRTKMEDAVCRALDYRWTVSGHHDPDSGLLYREDACIEVQDERFGVNGLHYIVSVQNTRGVDGGTYCDLRLIPANIWMFDTQDLSDKEYAELLQYKIDW